MPRQKQKRISIPTLSQASERKFKEATARGILARATLRCRDRTCSLDLHDFQLWQFVSTVSFFILPGLVDFVPVFVVVPSISTGVPSSSLRSRAILRHYDSESHKKKAREASR